MGAHILETTMFIVFSIGFVAGWRKFIRKPGGFASALCWIFGVTFNLLISFSLVDVFLVGHPLNDLEFFSDIFLPGLVYLVAGYILGELVRIFNALVNVGVPTTEPSRLAKIVNSIGRRIFPASQTFDNGGVELKVAVSVASWLYMDICDTPRQLTKAIGDNFELSNDDRIDLIIHLKNPRITNQRASRDLRAIRKYNRQNIKLNEKLYARLVNIGINANIDIVDIKSQLKSVAVDLNISLKRADEIINSTNKNARPNT